MSGYPRDRNGVWATDYEKVMQAAQVARSLGHAAYVLLRIVAMKEHKIHYLQPPDFWNGQLMDECALRDEESFVALRTRLVRAGWLVYQRADRQGVMGRYWVTIPDEIAAHLTRIPGAAKIPRSNPGNYPGTPRGTSRGKHLDSNPDTSPDSNPDTSRGSTRGTTRDLPPPLPIPVPTPTPTPGDGGGADGGEDWQSLKDRRARIEAVLDSLQVATGPKATPRWIAAVKACKRVHTMGDWRACLVDVVGGARAAGETVNFASDVADRIRRWKPEVQS